MTRALQLLAILGATLAPAWLVAAEPARDQTTAPEEPKLVLGVDPITSFWQHLYDGEFRAPSCVFYDARTDEVLVCDTGNHLIGIFDRLGHPLFAFGNDEHVQSPFRVATDASGRIYVLGADRAHIKLFNYRGEFLENVELAGLPKNPTFTTFTLDTGGNLFVAENDTGQVYVYGPDRKLRLRFGRRGEEPGEFQSIASIWASPNYFIVVDHMHTPAVQMFDRRGNYLRGWGAHEMGFQNFSMPEGLVVDSKGRIIVVDALRHEIKVFDLEGNYLDRFGGMGAGPGQVNQPVGIAIDAVDRIYVAEKLGNRVQFLAEVEREADARARARARAERMRH